MINGREIMSLNPAGCWTFILLPFLTLSLSHSCVSLICPLVGRTAYCSIIKARYAAWGQTQLNVHKISPKNLLQHCLRFEPRSSSPNVVN